MSVDTIASPRLTPEQVVALGHAATTLAMLDHYLKHGSVPDRKMATQARIQADALQALIDQENVRRQMGSMISYPNDR